MPQLTFASDTCHSTAGLSDAVEMHLIYIWLYEAVGRHAMAHIPPATPVDGGSLTLIYVGI